MPTERPRITITMSEDQLEQVKVFQHSNRMNQTQAILHLIELGFSQLDYPEDNNKKAAPANNNAEAAKREEELNRLALALARSGFVGESKELSDNDLQFLKGIVSVMAAHFKKD